MRHFEEQLDDLRKRLLAMSGLVESAIYRSILALIEKDEDQANLVLQNDAELARSGLRSDDAVDEMRDLIYRKLVSYMQQDPRSVPQGIDFIFVARNLERVADHATNIAEDVVFLVEGVDVRHHAEV